MDIGMWDFRKTEDPATAGRRRQKTEVSWEVEGWEVGSLEVVGLSLEYSGAYKMVMTVFLSP